ncbi:MAG: glycine cleavage system aminomethyltransferase T, partial [Flavobacteriales bacterium]
ELGLGRLVDLNMEADFIGKVALSKIEQEGVTRQQVGIEIDCPALQSPNTRHWPISIGSKKVGYVTSAIYSPRLKRNIALAMIDSEYSSEGTTAVVDMASGQSPIIVVPKPFYDPKKIIAGVVL